MTITTAWVRDLNGCKELIVVSDSRLNGGKKIDCVQKVHALSRSDAFISFAGDTSWAYPLMHQVISAIANYQRSLSRAQDIVELKTHILKVFGNMMNSVHNAVSIERTPQVEFLFGGYSWIKKKFLIWHIYYHPPLKKFEAHPAKEWKGQPWVFAGDVEHVETARKKLRSLLIERHKAPHQVDSFKFDWEPFEVIRDMLREVDNSIQKHNNESIGGAPQILKVYEHLNTKYIGVKWEIKNIKNSNGIYVCGRQLLEYEDSDTWVLHPDNLITHRYVKNSKKYD